MGKVDCLHSNILTEYDCIHRSLGVVVRIPLTNSCRSTGMPVPYNNCFLCELLMGSMRLSTKVMLRMIVLSVRADYTLQSNLIILYKTGSEKRETI